MMEFVGLWRFCLEAAFDHEKRLMGGSFQAVSEDL